MIREVTKPTQYLCISGDLLASFNVSWRCILKRKALDGSASLTVRDGRAYYNVESRLYCFHRERCIRASWRISVQITNWLKQLIRAGYIRRMQCLALREVFAYASRKEFARNLFITPSLKRALFWVKNYFLLTNDKAITHKVVILRTYRASSLHYDCSCCYGDSNEAG